MWICPERWQNISRGGRRISCVATLCFARDGRDSREGKFGEAELMLGLARTSFGSTGGSSSNKEESENGNSNNNNTNNINNKNEDEFKIVAFKESKRRRHQSHRRSVYHRRRFI